MAKDRVACSVGRQGRAPAIAAGTAALMLLCHPGSGRAGPDYTAWQEITVLTVNKLEAAAAACRLTINNQKLDVLLTSADLTLETIHSRPASSVLRQQIDAYAAGFRANRDGACAEAWEAFGADADPGVRDLLLR